MFARYIQARSAVVTRVAAVAFAVVLACSLAFAAIGPQTAWADYGDVLGWAYLDKDSAGKNTALIVQDTKRTDAEVKSAQCIELGAWRDGATVPELTEEGADDPAWAGLKYPWYNYKSTLKTATFVARNAPMRPTDSLASMFAEFAKLEMADLSGLDTSGVTDMSLMFSECSRLEGVDVSGLDTSSVQDMSAMFGDCSSVVSLDVSHFDTANVRDMYGMFERCESLRTIDLSNFSTSNVADMRWMFSQCYSLVSLDLSSFSMTQATETERMLQTCTSLTKLVLGKGAYLNGAEMPDIIYEANKYAPEGDYWYPEGDPSRLCGTTESLNAVVAESDGPVAFLRLMGDMSGTCGTCVWRIDDGALVVSPLAGAGVGALDSWDVPPWLNYSPFITSARFEGTVRAQTCEHLFDGCDVLASVDLAGLDTANATSMASMFAFCSSLRSVDLSSLSTQNATDMSWMFGMCTSLEAVGLSSLDTSKVANMSCMFAECRALGSADLSGFDLSSVADASDMFADCEALVQVTPPRSANLDKATTVAGMFSGCSLLGAIDLSHIYAPRVADASYMFSNCSSLTDVKPFGFVATVLEDASGMLSGCSSLTSVDLWSARVGSADQTDLLAGCDALREVTVTNTTHLTGDMPGGLWETENGQLRTLDNLPAWSGLCTRVSRTSTERAYAVLDDAGCLTVNAASADGAAQSWPLTEFNAGQTAPWSTERAAITSVVVLGAPEGVDYSYESIAGWFDGCANLTSADLEALDCTYTTDAAGLFRRCAKLTDLTMPSAGATRIENCSEAFFGCSALATLDLSGFDTRATTSMRRMLHGCRALESVVLGDDFTFRGALPYRLPGSELPDGVWLPDEAHLALNDERVPIAYASNSLPSFSGATFTQVTQGEIEAGDVVVQSLHGDAGSGARKYTVNSTIEPMVVNNKEVLVECQEYVLDDEYAGDTFTIGALATASAKTTRKVSGDTHGNVYASTIVSVKAPSKVVRIVIKPNVKYIQYGAFRFAPSCTQLTLQNTQLKSADSVRGCLVGSHITYAGIAATKGSSQVRNQVVTNMRSYGWQG